MVLEGGFEKHWGSPMFREGLLPETLEKLMCYEGPARNIGKTVHHAYEIL